MAARRVVGVSPEINNIGCPTGWFPPFDIQRENADLSNRFAVANENENPGATAIATGAKDVVECVCCPGEYIALFPILAMHWGALV